MTQHGSNLVAVTALLISRSLRFGFFIFYSTSRSIPDEFIEVQIKLRRHIYIAANVR